jgi:hypothetical protein
MITTQKFIKINYKDDNKIIKLCGLSPQANYTLPTDRRCRRS